MNLSHRPISEFRDSMRRASPSAQVPVRLALWVLVVVPTGIDNCTPYLGFEFFE